MTESRIPHFHVPRPLPVLLIAMLLTLSCSLLATPLHGAEKSPGSLNFEKDRTGSLPAGWAVAETNGKEKPASWEVQEDGTAPGSSQTVAITKTDNTGKTYNLLVHRGTAFKDGTLSVSLKALRGTEDQGGGLIWRALDEKNYYIARWNPLEKNLRLYYVKESVRTKLASVDIDTAPSAWHTLTVTHRGTSIQVGFDGKTRITAKDATFEKQGFVGFWTKADAAVRFGSLTLKPDYTQGQK